MLALAPAGVVSDCAHRRVLEANRTAGAGFWAGDQPAKMFFQSNLQTRYSPITSPSFSCASRFFLSNAWA